MSKPRILCTGAESSGTKLVTSLLRQAGAEVDHSSPNYRREQNQFPHTMRDYGAVVIVVRNWYTNAKSMIDAGHTHIGTEHARELMYYGLSDILYGLRYGFHNKIYFVTYESLVHEPFSLEVLCEELGLDYTKITDTVGDGNAKYYGGEFFRDQRELHER